MKRKILLITDMDGCTNIWRRLQTFQGTSSWKEARYDYLDDVNATIDALEITFEDPIIYLVDVHEEGYNFPKQPIGRNLIFQPGIKMGELPFFNIFPPVDSAIFVGFHTGPGEKGFAAYLFKPKFKEIRVNGELWGELEFFIQLLAIRNIPLFFVAGTEEVVKKAEARFPGITTLVISKEPEHYRGNIATRRYVMEMWDRYREQIKLAFKGRGFTGSPIEKGELVITFKDNYKSWCLPGYKCQKDGRRLKYNFEHPEDPLFIIFLHAYFTNKISVRFNRIKLTWQNFIRNLKSRGIIKGF